ncbi:MAG: helix-turn-helix domain-containing protein [Phaeodactylibacter xiamenensis]|nr:helix-turn-helix transcriptional regulator [Phaeodactylibacter xiamenensis]
MILIVRRLIIYFWSICLLKRHMPYDKDEQSYLSQLGARIRKLRKAKQLSQEALAFEADLDRTYVSSVERGERNIAVLNLAKLARALGVEVSTLLQEE